MTFASFVERYTEDMKPRLKENTWHTKEHVIRTKFLPYFGKRKLSEIKSQDILRWQNELTTHTDENGKPFSPVYITSSWRLLTCTKIENNIKMNRICMTIKSCRCGQSAIELNQAD